MDTDGYGRIWMARDGYLMLDPGSSSAHRPVILVPCKSAWFISSDWMLQGSRGPGVRSGYVYYNYYVSKFSIPGSKLERHGPMAPWPHGPMAPWPHGPMAPWPHGPSGFAMLRHAAPCCAMLRHASPGRIRCLWPSAPGTSPCTWTGTMPAMRAMRAMRAMSPGHNWSPGHGLWKWSLAAPQWWDWGVDCYGSEDSIWICLGRHAWIEPSRVDLFDLISFGIWLVESAPKVLAAKAQLVGLV